MKVPTRDDLPAIATLLKQGGLPTDDLDDQDLSLFRVETVGATLVAVGGLEPCGEAALLRSVATDRAHRGRGAAKRIVLELERIAMGRGIEELYLLTESASDYFAALGYRPCERGDVPQPVRESAQFASLCPDSAAVMSKRLRNAPRA